MEKHIQELLESEKELDKDTLVEELKEINRYIFNLNITQMRQPLDFVMIMTNLPLVSNMSLNFGLKHSGMNYVR